MVCWWRKDFRLPSKARKEVVSMFDDWTCCKIEWACGAALGMADEDRHRIGTTKERLCLKKANDLARQLSETLKALEDSQILQAEVQAAAGPEQGYSKVLLESLPKELDLLTVATRRFSKAKQGRNIDRPARFLKYQLYQICGKPKRNYDPHGSIHVDNLSLLFRILGPVLDGKIKLPDNGNNIIVEFSRS